MYTWLYKNVNARTGERETKRQTERERQREPRVPGDFGLH